MHSIKTPNAIKNNGIENINNKEVSLLQDRPEINEKKSKSV